MKCSVKISLNNNQQLKDFGSQEEIPNSKHMSQSHCVSVSVQFWNTTDFENFYINYDTLIDSSNVMYIYRKLSPHTGIEKSLHNNLLESIHCKMCYDFGIGGEMRWNDSHHISTGWIPATNSRRYILRLLPVFCMYGSWWCGELLTGKTCTFRVRTCT